MTPEQLKASILQYAIQGKLVEQRPEEGTGEELFQQIQTECKHEESQLKRRGKKVSSVAITEQDPPFDIPETWKWVKLGQLGYTNIGLTYSPKDVSNDGIVVLRSSNIQNGKMDYEDIVKVSCPVPDNKICHIGDILICARNGSKRLVGKAALIDQEGMSFGAFMAIFRSVCNPYILHVINSAYFRNTLLGDTGTTTINQITQDMLKNVLIPLPPLEEQHRIVAKIEELLPYVDRYAAAYEKLEQFNAKFPEDMKKSILQYAIQGKLVEQRPEEGTGEELYRQIQKEKQLLIKEGKLKKTRALPTIMDEEVPYDFPASWKVCYIDDIAFVTKLAGFEYTKYIADNLVPTGIPLFKGKNVQNGKLVLSFESYIPENVSDELPRSQITKKCLLTPYVGTIGNIAVFDGSFKAHLGSNVGKIELLNPDTQTFILEEYVLWYLKSTYGYAELTKYKKATAQESISIDAIRNVVIAIPPLEEQRRIVAKIEELLPYCDKLK